MTTAVICGAGTAGLGTAVALRRLGVHAEVLERSETLGASWRARYDDLRLNTPAWISSMPGYRATRRRYGTFPTRDDWVRYIEDYTAHHDLEVRHGVTAHSLRRGERWTVGTDGGDVEADVVVVALGMDHQPVIPAWKGRDGYTGELLHSSSFRSARPYRDRDVLVVGPNVTGSEIAALLVDGGAARVRVSCRTPPNIVRRRFLGMSVSLPGIALSHVPLGVSDQVLRVIQRVMFGDLSAYGLPRSSNGVATEVRTRRRSPAFDSGFVDRLKAGRIEIVGAVTDIDRDDVILADGRPIRPDVVIAATGYRPGLEHLVGHLDVLDADGYPLCHGGQELRSAPGLYFNGYRFDLSGQLRTMRLDAESIARAVVSS